MARKAVVYLLHFERRYHHAGHYLGTAKDLHARLEAHRLGKGARLMEVIRNAGIDFQVVKTWCGGRAKERQLKRRHGPYRLCPLCNPGRIG